MRDIPTLFIASSGRAGKLAHALETVLNASGEVQAEAWVGEEAFANNRQILETLLAHAREKDFAVVLLTRDNVLALDDDIRVGVPRANCVFELGLFIGAFGKPERCFLLSSLAPQVMLDQLIDVGGQVYEGMEVPDDLQSEGLCGMIAEQKSQAILRMVREHGRYEDRPRWPALTTRDLLAVEASAGRLQQGCAVVIKERELPETRLRFAAVVRENMKRTVNYLYLFAPELENYPRIVGLVRSLILAGLVSGDYEIYDKLSEDDKKTLLASRREAALAELDKITPHLFVELIAAAGFDEFCIHMADRNSRRGYLKVGDDTYVEMSSRSARERYEYAPYLARRQWPTLTIFHPAPERVPPEQLEGIRYQIEDKFPASLQEAVFDACFASAAPLRLSAVG